MSVVHSLYKHEELMSSSVRLSVIILQLMWRT